jgi:signal transduction histidine kinase
MGYEIARICIAEKALAGCDSQAKECFRTIVKNIAQIQSRVIRCVDERGCDAACELHDMIMKNIDSLKFAIELLPQGMVKERFIGGLAIFYNISYIIKSALAETMKGGS